MSVGSIPDPGSGSTIPNGGTGGTSGSGSTSNNSSFSPLFTSDSLNSAKNQPGSLNLYGISSQVSLPEGQISIFEFAQEVALAKHKFLIAMNTSTLQDTTLFNFYSNATSMLGSIADAFVETLALVQDWNDQLTAVQNQIDNAFGPLQGASSSFNSLVFQTEARDEQALYRTFNGRSINTYINAYNDPVAWKALVIAFYGSFTPANSQNTVNFVNTNVIDVYNSMQANRPNLQSALNGYNQLISNYNHVVNQGNNTISDINAELTPSGISARPLLNPTITPSSFINTYLSYNSQIPPSLPRLTFPIGSTPIGQINVFPNSGNITPLPPITYPGTVVLVGRLEGLFGIWVPFVFQSLFFMSGFLNRISLTQKFIEAENSFYRLIPGLSIIFPSAYVNKAPDTFTASSGPSGLDSGLLALAIGNGGHNLLGALSTALFTASALDHQLPLTSRVFGRLQMTALDLLQKTGLLASLPGLGIATSGMGAASSSTESVNVAVALATLQQLGLLEKSDILRSIVNQYVNLLPAYGRLRQAASEEIAKLFVSSSGVAGVFASSVDSLSLGQLAAFTNTASAAMSLSILAAGLALLGGIIGIPDLAGQVIGNSPSSGIQPSLNGYATISDLLDNPLAILSLKQNLANIAKGEGLSGKEIDQVINLAVNNVVLKGGIASLSSLASALRQEFLSAGLSPIIANLLANQASVFLRADLGLNFLNSAYGKNATNAEIMDQIKSVGAGVSNQGISALNDVLAQSGDSYQTQREFRDHIFDGLKERGVNDYEATYLSNSASNYALNGVLNPPTGVSSSGLKQISDSAITALTGILGISSASAESIVEKAKFQTLAEGPFSNADQFALVFKEQLTSEIQKTTGSNKGSVISDQAIAGSSGLLSLPDLKNLISTNTIALLSPSIGVQGAEAVNNQLLLTLFGTSSSQELPKISNKHADSISNQVKQVLKELEKESQTQSLESVTNNVNEVIAAWIKPNAQIGFLFQSIMDAPSTFITSAVQAQKSSGVNLQIPI